MKRTYFVVLLQPIVVSGFVTVENLQRYNPNEDDCEEFLERLREASLVRWRGRLDDFTKTNSGDVVISSFTDVTKI